MLNNHFVIAQLERISTKDDRHFGHLKPLCLVHPNSSAVEHIGPHELREDFPNRGCVSWVGIPSTVPVGSVWEFRAAEQPYDMTNPTHDRYKVAQSPFIPYEVIDVRDLETAECAESFFASSGIQLRFRPNERVLLRLDNDEFLGPVRLIPNHVGLLTVEVTRNGQPVPPFSLYSIPPERLIQLDCDGNRRTFVSAGINLGAPQSQVDWSPEELILKRVLRHARETDNGNLPDLTNKLVDAIAKTLSEVGSPLEHYRVQRASRILLNAQSVERVLPSITSEILSLPKVKTLLDGEKETAKKAAEEEIKAALREKISEVQSMDKQAAALRNELENLENRIRETEKEYETRTGNLENGFKTKLRELVDSPGELIAELAVLRSALTVPSTKGSDQLPARVPEPFIVPPEWKQNGRNIQSLAELKKAAKQHRGDTSPDTIRQILGTLASGLMPVVTGARALRSLSSIGDCIAGGRTAVVPVSPNYADPVDLFGKILNARFIPSAGDLANFLLQARDSEGLFLVILDGINKAAVESYLLPVLRLYCAAQSDKASPLALFSSVALIKNDPYRTLGRLTWPRNVLVAATAVKGPSVFPLTGDILRFSTLIYAQSVEEDSSTVETPEITSIAADRWHSLFEPTKESDDSLGVLIAQLTLETDVDKAQTAKLFSRIAALSGTNTSGTALDVLRISLLPMLIALSKADNLSKYMNKSGNKNELSRLQDELTPLLTWK